MNTPDFIQALVQYIETHALSILLILLVLVIVIFMLGKKINNRWLNYKTHRCLKSLGAQQLHNFQWPDGLGHYFNIDCLILSKHGITLLMYKPYPGKIFCAEHIGDWTQMLGKKSYRFKNPLYDLDLQIKAVSSYIPSVPVNGFLFFDHLAVFPKGHPERVIYPNKMPEELQHIKTGQVEPSVKAAWEKLLTMRKDK